MQELIKLIEAPHIREDIPEFKAGDTVNIHVRIVEGDKERVQQYKGVCLQRRNSGASETFTVRKISSGIGVERIFQLNSPNIAKIDVLRRGKVRRARLFYLRDKIGKQARIKELVKK
ncbi:50S ribosomal protein L19 [Pontibacter sp. G13]|uniref:50S ribosomal protein L19 n=1 Tax=Pontibacter sp. G13 TaxID=3074898 RepID=UPI00288B4C91|nr:50S ribosomal protein L19 [Pontibacter sp. G13]WNJ16917.1 50S ribosomal protein L19 [Pontibacter sp. G13]